VISIIPAKIYSLTVEAIKCVVVFLVAD